MHFGCFCWTGNKVCATKYWLIIGKFFISWSKVFLVVFLYGFSNPQLLSSPQGGWKISTAASPSQGREKLLAWANKINLAKQNQTWHSHGTPGQWVLKIANQNPHKLPPPQPWIYPSWALKIGQSFLGIKQGIME